MSAVATLRPAFPTALKRPLLLLAALLLAMGLLYGPTLAGMVGIWMRSDTFAHGFLVPPISLWLIWRNRSRLAPLQPKPDARWLLPLAVAVSMWLLAELVSVNALAQFAAVTMIVLAVPLMLGWPATRVMAFPLLFLFFCVPVGEFLLPVLMERTADFTIAAVRLSGVPVYREGLNFVIPTGSWSVVEACSGVRYLIASVMVGSLFAYLNYRSLKRRLLFLGVAILVPIFANWVRAYIIVMLGHLSNNRIATGVDHLVYGWVFFGIVISIMFMVGARWAEAEPEPMPAPAIDPTAPPPALRPWLLPMVLALLLASLAPVSVRVLQRQVASTDPRLAMPAKLGDWVAGEPQTRWAPLFQGAAAQVHRSYRRGPDEVGVFVAYYRDQGDKRKVVSSTNVLVPSEDPNWNAVSTASRESSLGADSIGWQVTHVLAGKGSLLSERRSLTAWKTYWVDDAFTANDVHAKLRGALGMLTGRGDDAAIVVLYSLRSPDDGADTLLRQFAESNLADLRQALRQTRDAR